MNEENFLDYALEKYIDETTPEASEIIDRLLKELKLIQNPNEK